MYLSKKTTAIIALMALSISACATPTSVNPNTASADLVLNVSGSGSWTVECNATTNRGRSAVSKIRGKASKRYDVAFIQDATKATCEYKTDDHPIQLKLTENGLSCPFGTFQDEVCVTTIEARKSGSLEFTPVS